MQDKSQLGNRYTCYQCGCKFYDLNRPVATCPECGADQADAPVRDVKSLLKSGRKARKAAEPIEPVVVNEEEDAEEEEDEDESLGLLGDDDDDLD